MVIASFGMPPSGSSGFGARRVQRTTESLAGSPDATPRLNGLSGRDGAGGNVAVVVVVVVVVELVVTGGAVVESPEHATTIPLAVRTRNERRVRGEPATRGHYPWSSTLARVIESLAYDDPRGPSNPPALRPRRGARRARDSGCGRAGRCCDLLSLIHI